ncbi:hypothetical protein FFF34_008855 [Inquilinus sp. KBS0705]|nr:hypothetical protein FFF34_008855 [Inquilinus sp. KBS0705]
MGKIRYFFAAVYQSIKSRRPDGTPYFNLCLGVTGILLLNLFDVLLILKMGVHKNLISDSKNTFIIWFLSLAILIMILLKLFMPIDDIKDVEVEKKDVKLMGFLIISYYTLSLAFTIILISLTRPSMPH